MANREEVHTAPVPGVDSEDTPTLAMLIAEGGPRGIAAQQFHIDRVNLLYTLCMILRLSLQERGGVALQPEELGYHRRSPAVKHMNDLFAEKK